MILADDEQRWAYLSIPKCACTSIRTALESHWSMEPSPLIHNRDWLGHWHDVDWCIPEGTYSWTVIRCPLDRLLSTWADKCRGHQQDPDWPKTVDPVYRPVLGKPLTEFVEYIWDFDVDNPAMDAHLRSQSTFIGKRHLDFPIPFEHLSVRWAHLQRLYGFPPLPHYNKSIHSSVDESYTRVTRLAVKALYTDDLRLYRHSLESCHA